MNMIMDILLKQSISEFIKTTKKMRNPLRLIGRIIRIIAAIILITGAFCYGLGENIIDINDLSWLYLAQKLEMPSRIIWRVIIIFVVYDFLISRVIVYVLSLFCTETGNKLFPFVLTMEDLGDFFGSIIMLSYSIYGVVTWNNLLADRRIIYVAVGYLVGLFFLSVYYRNKSHWDSVSREWSDYYDVDGERIPADAYVIYNGKRYVVCGCKNVLTTGESQKPKWRIKSLADYGEEIILEVAVSNKGGELRLDKNQWP